jgi:hypothetical protein
MCLWTFWTSVSSPGSEQGSGVDEMAGEAKTVAVKPGSVAVLARVGGGAAQPAMTISRITSAIIPEKIVFMDNSLYRLS